MDSPTVHVDGFGPWLTGPLALHTDHRLAHRAPQEGDYNYNYFKSNQREFIVDVRGIVQNPTKSLEVLNSTRITLWAFLWKTC